MNKMHGQGRPRQQGINSLIRNMLIAVDSLTYEEPYYFPDIFKSTHTYEDHSGNLENNELKYLKVFPNPAKDYLIIEYLNESGKKGVIYINDLSGRLIDSYELSSSPDQWILDTRLWKSGLYIVTLKIRDRKVEFLKVSIIN